MHTGTQRAKHGTKAAAKTVTGTVDTRTFDTSAGATLMAAVSATARDATHQFGYAQLDQR